MNEYKTVRYNELIDLKRLMVKTLHTKNHPAVFAIDIEIEEERQLMRRIELKRKQLEWDRHSNGKAKGSSISSIGHLKLVCRECGRNTLVFTVDFETGMQHVTCKNENCPTHGNIFLADKIDRVRAHCGTRFIPYNPWKEFFNKLNGLGR